MRKQKRIVDIDNCVKVAVSPWKQGFTCGLISDNNNMSVEEFNLCSTIARGMIKQAVLDPHTTYLLGLKGFSEDELKSKSNNSKYAEVKEFNEDNIVDFLEYLKAKNNKEIH